MVDVSLPPQNNCCRFWVYGAKFLYNTYEEELSKKEEYKTALLNAPREEAWEFARRKSYASLVEHYKNYMKDVSSRPPPAPTMSLGDVLEILGETSPSSSPSSASSSPPSSPPPPLLINGKIPPMECSNVFKISEVGDKSCSSKDEVRGCGHGTIPARECSDMFKEISSEVGDNPDMEWSDVFKEISSEVVDKSCSTKDEEVRGSGHGNRKDSITCNHYIPAIECSDTFKEISFKVVDKSCSSKDDVWGSGHGTRKDSISSNTYIPAMECRDLFTEISTKVGDKSCSTKTVESYYFMEGAHEDFTVNLDSYEFFPGMDSQPKETSIEMVNFSTMDVTMETSMDMMNQIDSCEVLPIVDYGDMNKEVEVWKKKYFEETLTHEATQQALSQSEFLLAAAQQGLKRKREEQILKEGRRSTNHSMDNSENNKIIL